MKLKYFIYILLFLSGIEASAQKEENKSNNWLFGDKAGLTWNTTRSYSAIAVAGSATGTTILSGLPTVIQSSIVTDEGCFAMSDDSGRLLFYSDGSTVWNRNNVVMQNGTGLGGNFSASQSGIIMPYPGIATKYVAIAGGTMGESPRYSIIDMELANGLGGVVIDQKAIKLTGASGMTGESITSIKHANRKDYWVVAPGVGINSTYLNAWLISSTGTNIQVSNPVITQSPSQVSSHHSLGYIKFTADGRHFAWADDDSTVTFGDFDPETGQFSNLKYISYNTAIRDEPYGIEFSPSLKYLFVGGYKKLFVYDLDVLLNWPTVNATTAPHKVFDVGVEVNALQLSSDKRIYFTAFNTNFLYIITNPDDYDDLKIYQLNNYFLGSGISKIGLPSFSASWFKFEPEIVASSCAGSPTTVSIKIEDVAGMTATLDWDFGDGNTVLGQPVTINIKEYSQIHTYAIQGVYTITITPRKSDGTALDTITVAANIKNCTIKTNRMITNVFK